MKPLMSVAYLLVLVGWGAVTVSAVMPPVTSLESPPASGMSLMDWFLYGSIVIVLGAFFVGMVTLVVRLIISLFK